MKRYLSLFCLLFVLIAPLVSFGHSGAPVTSTVTRTVVPSVVKNYQPEKSSPDLTVLKLGVKDGAVALLQGFLLNRGYNPGSIDGSFGKATENALKSFQRDTFGELAVDGVAGPKTLKYIESLASTVNKQVATNTNSNTNTSSSNTESIKVKIPSLPNKVLAKALVAPSLVPVEQTGSSTKYTLKPKLTKSGFSNAGVFVMPSNNLNVSNTEEANLNTNFSSGTGTSNSKYVCGTKDGVESCFVVTLAEAAQIEAGTLDIDQVLASKSGGSGQTGACPSFYVDEEGNPGVTDQSWWNTEGCEDSNVNLALSGSTVCLDGVVYNQKTGVATGATCSSGLVSKSKTNLDRGAETCLTGTKYNPLTGSLCNSVANNNVYIEQPPLICATGAKYNPYTGVACKPGSEIKTDSFANTLAGYAIRNLGSVTKGQQGNDVNIVQRVLANYGFLDSKYQTGYSGDITQAAVTNFQKSLGLKETGQVSGETLSYIKAAIVADPNLQNLPKVNKNITKTESAEKVSTLLAKYPGGAGVSTQNVDTSSGTVSLNIAPTSFALNPTVGTDSADNVGQVSCRRITSSQWAPGGYYSVRGYIGTNKLFWIKSGTPQPTMKYTIPGQTGPYPQMKIVAGSGLSGLYFSYITKTGDGIPLSAYPSVHHQENKDIVFEVSGTDKIFSLSEDGKKYFSFDWTKLNDPDLPTCTMPPYGNGFIGIIRPDGTVGGVTGGNTGGGGTPPPVPQCMDGVDNDNDGKTDFPTDTGCSSATDTSENSDSSGGGGGGGGPALCADGIDNDGDGKTDFPTDTGCSSATDTSESSEGGGSGGTIQDGLSSTFDEAGAPCPTSAPCHFWHCPPDQYGHITQCNNWTPLRWAGPLPVEFTIENNFTSPLFLEALDRVIDDLNLLPNIHFTVVPGNGNCDGIYAPYKHIPVCEAFVGQVGWSGVASMKPDYTNRRILTGDVMLNKTYLSTNTSSDYAKAEANLVICQEILHVTGILHNDTPFSSLKKTCMDYYDTPWQNQHPNGFDAELLEIIYGTTSGSNLQTQNLNPVMSTNLINKFKQVADSIDIKDRTTWGVPTESTDGVITHYEKSFVLDGKTYSISRHLYPVLPK